MRDVITFLEKKYNTKVKIKATKDFFYWLTFEVDKETRTMSLFPNHKTPIGPASYLSLGYDEQAVKIMKEIAKIFGGLLNERDSDDNYEIYSGLFDNDSGLPYFYKNAVIRCKITDEDDLVGLNDSIHQWYDEVKEAKKDMKLFPRGDK